MLTFIKAWQARRVAAMYRQLEAHREAEKQRSSLRSDLQYLGFPENDGVEPSYLYSRRLHDWITREIKKQVEAAVSIRSGVLPAGARNAGLGLGAEGGPWVLPDCPAQSSGVGLQMPSAGDLNAPPR